MNATSEDARVVVDLYQAEWCPHSHRVRQRLTELGLDFAAHQVPVDPAERTAMLSDMQQHAPAPVLAAVLAQVQPHLTQPEWAKLMRSLGLPVVPGLVH